MLDTAYHLFSETGIAAVSMADIARATGYGNTTLHRYFSNKAALVVAVATWKWEEYTWERLSARGDDSWEKRPAAEQYAYFLDAFIDLYLNHRDMLRFNQFFNIYITSAQAKGEITGETLSPYEDMIHALNARFARMYKKALTDGTLRVEEGKEKIFSSSLHLMLAAVTRYAVGLVYRPEDGTTPEEELNILKEMMINRYTVKKQ